MPLARDRRGGGAAHGPRRSTGRGAPQRTVARASRAGVGPLVAEERTHDHSTDDRGRFSDHLLDNLASLPAKA